MTSFVEFVLLYNFYMLLGHRYCKTSIVLRVNILWYHMCIVQLKNDTSYLSAYSNQMILINEVQCIVAALIIMFN